MARPAFTLHQNDLPDGLTFSGSVAIDTETTGLRYHRDRLCLVQLCDADGACHLINVVDPGQPAPNLQALLRDEQVLKLFHFARFDMAMLIKQYGVLFHHVYCTKIASKLGRTNTDRHGLVNLVRDLLGIELAKESQQSDWGVAEKSPAQLAYACEDVLHLHALKAKLDVILQREERTSLAEAAFSHLPARAMMDLAGFEDIDIFAH